MESDFIPELTSMQSYIHALGLTIRYATGFSRKPTGACMNCAASTPSLTRWSTELVAYML